MPESVKRTLDLARTYCDHGMDFSDRGWFADIDRVLHRVPQTTQIEILRSLAKNGPDEPSPKTAYARLRAAIDEHLSEITLLGPFSADERVETCSVFAQVLRCL